MNDQIPNQFLGGFLFVCFVLIAKPFIIHTLNEVLLSDRLRELLGKGKQ